MDADMDFAELLDGDDTRPDGGECRHCGGRTEPWRQAGQWFGPAEICQTCDDLSDDHAEALHRQQRYESALSRCVPSRRHRRLASRLSLDDRLRAVLRRDHMPESGVYLHGPTGTGKTSQAVALVVETLRLWYLYDERPVSLESGAAPAEYLVEPEYFAALQRTFDGDGATADVVDRYAECGLLVLDDLATAQGTEWAYTELYRLIDRRYQSERATLFVGNSTLHELRGHPAYDSRITSRIYEMAGHGEYVYRYDDCYRL